MEIRFEKWFSLVLYIQCLERPLSDKHCTLTQNLDFAETFLDYAGVDIPKDMQGKSLRPLLEDTINDDDFRDAVYYHYYDYPAFHMVKKHYGIRTERYKLMHFYDDIDTWELYDLEEDPNEIHNQIDNPFYDEVESRLRKRLIDLQRQYQVTNEEFEQAPKESVQSAYEQFEKLRGTTATAYDPLK